MRVLVILGVLLIVAGSAYLAWVLVRMHRAHQRGQRLMRLAEAELDTLTGTERAEVLLELERQERIRQKQAEREAIESILRDEEGT